MVFFCRFFRVEEIVAFKTNTISRRVLCDRTAKKKINSNLNYTWWSSILTIFFFFTTNSETRSVSNRIAGAKSVNLMMIHVEIIRLTPSSILFYPSSANRYCSQGHTVSDFSIAVSFFIVFSPYVTIKKKKNRNITSRLGRVLGLTRVPTTVLLRNKQM